MANEKDRSSVKIKFGYVNIGSEYTLLKRLPVKSSLGEINS